jgi:hypothetical protein
LNDQKKQDEMCAACDTHEKDQKRSLIENNNFGDLGINGRIILKGNRMAWTGFDWRGLVMSSGELL